MQRLFRYPIGIITLVQFVLLSFLGIANGLNSIVSTCNSDHGDCISNMIVSIIFFILTVAWFAFIWVLGYTAQERRSQLLCASLIGAELLIGIVALFNAKHHTDILSLITSAIDLILAVWIILLAARLLRAGGGRVAATSSGQRRRRRHATTGQ